MKFLKENIGYIIITILTFLLSLVNKNVSFVTTLLSLLIYSIVQYKPILALVLLLLKNIIYVVIEPSLFGSSIGINLIFLLTALLVNIKIVKINEEKLKDRIVTLVNYKRSLLKVKPWIKIVIYSFLITLVMSVTKLSEVQEISSELNIQIFTAIALLLPTIEFLSILSTSSIFIDIIIFTIVFKAYTLVKICLIDDINYTEVYSLILAVFALIYGAYKRLKWSKN